MIFVHHKLRKCFHLWPRPTTNQKMESSPTSLAELNGNGAFDLCIGRLSSTPIMEHSQRPPEYLPVPVKSILRSLSSPQTVRKRCKIFTQVSFCWWYWILDIISDLCILVGMAWGYSTFTTGRLEETPGFWIEDVEDFERRNSCIISSYQLPVPQAANTTSSQIDSKIFLASKTQGKPISLM